jgi:hypothetical protein
MRNIKAEALLGAVNMPDIAKEPTYRMFDNIVSCDSFFITGLLQYRKRLDRFFSKDMTHEAYSYKKNITSDKYIDNIKREIKSTGRQQVPLHSRHHGLQHGQQPVLHHKPRYRSHQSEHFEQHHGHHHDLQRSLQYESQHRPHQDRHFELQHAKNKEQQLVNMFINEIMYLPLA